MIDFERQRQVRVAADLSYYSLKNELAGLEEDLLAKKQEFSPLNNAISATKKEISTIELEIENAPAELAAGNIKTDDILNLHERLSTLKKSLADFEKARAIQQESLNPTHNRISIIGDALTEKRKNKRAELPIIYAGKLDKTAVNECLMTFLANSENALNHRNVTAFNAEFFNYFRDNFGFPSVSDAHKFCENVAQELLESEEF